jgi:DNA replication protein DnaC
MEQIKDVLPSALETLEHSTKAFQVNTEGWEKWFPEFQTLGDPQLEWMKQEAVRFVREVISDWSEQDRETEALQERYKDEALAKLRELREQIKTGQIPANFSEQLEQQKADYFEKTSEKKLRGRWLTFLGKSGAGKTMLARGITRRLNGHFARWTTVCNSLKEGEFRLFHDFCHEPVVCLDDIGSEQKSEFVNAKLYEFMSNREKRWTIITANLSLEAISEQMETRIASRMIRNNSKIVDADVPDWNLRRPSNL